MTGLGGAAKVMVLDEGAPPAGARYLLAGFGDAGCGSMIGNGGGSGRTIIDMVATAFDGVVGPSCVSVYLCIC